MRRLDRARSIEFIDLGAVDSACPLDRTLMLARFHAEENGILYSGAAAFAAMWRAIPALRPLGLAAKNKFVLAALERLYLIFLRLRPHLQRLMRRLDQKP